MKENGMHSRISSAGYTLIELLIAMLISLPLLGGLFSILQGTHRTSSNQTSLAQLQNSERIAMTLLTDVIQQAGYYPDPQTSTLQSAFPPSAASPAAPAPAFTQAGQFIAGETNATALGDSITVRYQTDFTGTVLNCLGQTHDAAALAHAYTFSVNGSGQLACSVDGNTPVPVAGNVKNMRILYGVDTDSTDPSSGSAPSAYVSASDMTAVNWTNVRSVKIVLTFVNPLAGQPGQDNAPAITATRTVGVMVRAGVNVVTST
jgi:type IV pilus assembly protein PilW